MSATERLARVDGAIRDAAIRAGRDPESITRIVVSKFHPASLVRELADAGVRDFGESRHQEAAVKAAELASERGDITWHFVGQLQSKKARHALDYARVIHSVDRESLVAALEGERDAIDCFVQLNLTDDPSRGGVQPADVDALADRVASAEGLRLVGLMAIAPLGEEPRRAFARVREASERLRRSHPDAAALSMGMSNDFGDAILEGATHLRIGTAITGMRPERG